MTQTAPASLPLFWSPPELHPLEPEPEPEPEESDFEQPEEQYLSRRSEKRAPRGHFSRTRTHVRRMPGADGKQSVTDPAEYGISQEELDAITDDLIEFRIDISPANILHAIEANNLRRLLREMGINPTKRVSSTRDRMGMVRLTFVDLRQLMDQGFFAQQERVA